MVKLANLIPRILWVFGFIFMTVLFAFESVWVLGLKDYQYLNLTYSFIGIYIFVSIMFFWCYVKVCWCDPGSSELFYKEHGMIPTSSCEPLKTLPVCSKCELPKPLRTHHCSVCDKCCFRFDHHCPVLGNCIALRNYKAFVLLPIYGGLVIGLPLMQLAALFHPLCCLVCLLIPITTAGIAIHYCCDTCNDTTTLEGIMDLSPLSFSDGSANSFWGIFGSLLTIFLPTDPKVTGFHWCENDLEKTILQYTKQIGKVKDGALLEVAQEEP